MSFIRKIDKIKNFIASCVLWKLGDTNRMAKAPLYFIDGLIAINSSESMLIGENQPDLFALNIGEYQKLREQYQIKDNDVFVGRENNYLLFRDGVLTIKTTDLVINASKIIYNGLEINVTANIISINGKQVAVIGGDVDLLTGKITASGQ
jgi:hypothetical protein